MNKNKDIKEAHIYFPRDVYAKLEKLAKKERRSINRQILVMVEKQLEKQK